MKSRLWANVLLALAVLALGLFLFLKPEKAGPEKFSLSTLSPAQVTRIRIEPRNTPAIVIERRGESFHLTAPFPARADRFRIDALLGILSAQTETRLPARTLEKFGLAPPHVRLVVAAAGREQVFEFGDRQPVSERVYVATGGWVYLVSPAYLVDVSRGAEDFVAKSPLAPEEVPVAFELPGLRLTRVDGRWQREPDDARLDADTINRFADEWRLAQAIAVRRAGKAPAPETVRLRFAHGGSAAFGLIRREGEVVLRREDEGLEYVFPADVGARLTDPAKVPAGP